MIWYEADFSSALFYISVLARYEKIVPCNCKKLGHACLVKDVNKKNRVLEKPGKKYYSNEKSKKNLASSHGY